MNSQAQINVLEIDTGVFPHKDFKEHLSPKNTNWDLTDSNGHGTHLAGLILKDTCKEVKLYSCKYFDYNNSPSNMQGMLNCLRIANKLKLDLINIASGGENFDQEEFDLLNKLSEKGIKIVVSAGNEDRDLSKNPWYPANYNIKNIVTVGNFNKFGEKCFKSNYGLKNEVWEIGVEIESTLPNDKYGKMTGTSQASAIRSNRILKEMCEKQ